MSNNYEDIHMGNADVMKCGIERESGGDDLKPKVLPTHPPELSGNTGELKQTKDPLKMTAINDDPILFSLLYDLDLLPEQVKEGNPDYVRMQIIIEHWNMKQTKETLSDDLTSKDWMAACDILTKQLNCMDKEIPMLKSQLEDYRKALEEIANMEELPIKYSTKIARAALSKGGITQ